MYRLSTPCLGKRFCPNGLGKTRNEIFTKKNLSFTINYSYLCIIQGPAYTLADIVQFKLYNSQSVYYSCHLCYL